MFKLARFLGLLGILAATSASAGYIQSDIFRIYDPTGAVAFEFGVTESGGLLGGAACATNFGGACVPNAENDPANGSDVNIYYLPVAGLAAAQQRFTQLNEAEDPTIISDIFGSLGAPGGAFPNFPVLFFISDSEAGLPDFGAEATFVENGQPFDATTYLDPGLIAQGWTASFLSEDVHVPLPGTLALLGLGLMGLGLARRK